MKKKFYNIVPYLLLPGLIMSAVLPFVLPALKLMTFAVGMLNNMALSGAIFTLLRNNAFNDKYVKKVVYVNEGYRNEKPIHSHHSDYHADAVYEVQYEDKHNHDVLQRYHTVPAQNFGLDHHIEDGSFDIAEEIPDSSSNTDWSNHNYDINDNEYIKYSNHRFSHRSFQNKEETRKSKPGLP
jgi:hypothetical protein